MSHKNEAFFRKQYQELKNVKQEDAQKAKPEHFKKAIEAAGDKNTSPDFARNLFITFVKLAHTLSEDEFVEATLNNEMPPIRLTTKEMEVLKGGRGQGGCYMPGYDSNRWHSSATINAPGHHSSSPTHATTGAVHHSPAPRHQSQPSPHQNPHAHVQEQPASHGHGHANGQGPHGRGGGRHGR